VVVSRRQGWGIRECALRRTIPLLAVLVRGMVATPAVGAEYVFRLRVRHYARFPYFLGYSRAVNVFVR
jgi:hypothetical protein